MWGLVWVRKPGLKALTYILPDAWGPYQRGLRVLVPLGKHNFPHMGLIMGLYETPPPFPNPKTILQKLDTEPLYDEAALQFFEWLASYYMALPGDVACTILPGRVGGIADWKVSWVAELDAPALAPKKLYLKLRHQATFSVRRVAAQLGLRPSQVFRAVRQWFKAGQVRIEAIVRQSARLPPSFVEIDPAYQNPTAFKAAWESLPEAQQALAMRILQATLRQEPLAYAHLRRTQGKALRPLLQAGLVRCIPASRYYEKLYARPLQAYTLTPAQQAALTEIRQALANQPTRPVLLYGVTASGKTFIFMELMRSYLQAGKQVLYLLPEIALTKQTLDRLRATFGEALALYHSGLSEAERFRLWKAVREDAVDVIVGTRSALFLPFHRLGLILVDEEHDPSYGQEGRAPLYQARDAAIYYARLRKIPIILGSATPALESYFNAQQGKYAWVTLTEKALPTLPPELYIVDMRTELRAHLSTGVFSSTLVELLEEMLRQGRQAILFRNRRGYASLLLCAVCGHLWECPNCAVSLTYHKSHEVLICHYCGHRTVVPAHCPVCGSQKANLLGVGTQRIEEQLKQFFPQVRVLRMDRDTTRGSGYSAIIAAFERGEADILIGTQMVTKGLDFERVGLVGVLYADALLARQDFRAEERAYQLLVQLMGRAGRRGSQSYIVIQTFRPQHPLFQQLTLPFPVYAEAALEKRRTYGYPPYRRLIQVYLHHTHTATLETQAQQWGDLLRRAQLGEVLGPVYAEPTRIRRYYRMQLLWKLPPAYDIRGVRQYLERLGEAHYRRWGRTAARLTFRVDP
ncbi:MAG: primosomal protein N' [Bacteroidia bacterium]